MDISHISKNLHTRLFILIALNKEIEFKSDFTIKYDFA